MNVSTVFEGLRSLSTKDDFAHAQWIIQERMKSILASSQADKDNEDLSKALSEAGISFEKSGTRGRKKDPNSISGVARTLAAQGECVKSIVAELTKRFPNGSPSSIYTAASAAAREAKKAS